MQDNCVQLSSLQYWMRIIYTPIRWSKLFNHAATRHHHSHICYLSIASTFLLIRSQVRFIALKSSYWLNHIILIEHLYKLLIKPQLSNGIPMIAKVLISHHRIPICSHLPGELIVESGGRRDGGWTLGGMTDLAILDDFPGDFGGDFLEDVQNWGSV